MMEMGKRASGDARKGKGLSEGVREKRRGGKEKAYILFELE